MNTVARAFSLTAHAKLNLRLEIGPPMGGLHSIVSAMAELELADKLRFAPAAGGFHVSCDSGEIAARENLVWRAAQALLLPLPDVSIAITKRIPMLAGLGGGSADAAAALRGLAQIFDERGAALSQRQIADAALRAGSDVPSFLVPGLKIVTGIGDRITPFECAVPPWGVVLLQPEAGSSTAQAYIMLDEAAVPHDLAGADARAQEMTQAFASHDFERFVTLLHNDFSGVIEGALPQVASARRRLEQTGARATILCGSGSCVAGFLESRAAAEGVRAQLPTAAGEWATVTTFADAPT